MYMWTVDGEYLKFDKMLILLNNKTGVLNCTCKVVGRHVDGIRNHFIYSAAAHLKTDLLVHPLISLGELFDH